MLSPNLPALLLAPMDGVTDPPMRALQGEFGVFSFGVSEFLRVSEVAIPRKVFVRDVPELLLGGMTSSGMPVQVQILGGDPVKMAESAVNAWRAGAQAIDINFGCPAPTVNRNDGGASLLKFPGRLRDIVAAVRDALPPEIPVSAKLRLGWDEIDDIDENARLATAAGAAWLTIHARTKAQRYAPPVFWKKVGEVRRALAIPVVANGDIWSLDDFLRCREETGCRHFMIGRGALARPGLARQIAGELGLPTRAPLGDETDWPTLLSGLSRHCKAQPEPWCRKTLHRLKQWLNFAHRFGEFAHFDAIKQCQTEEAFFEFLHDVAESPASAR